MKELSLNILDIVENSIKAEAKNIFINIKEDAETLSITVIDDGYGMSEEFLKNVTDPFCTTRTTRKVGLGIPFLKLEAELTGGKLDISSKAESDYPDDHGTTISAVFYKNHIDMTPLGDIRATIMTLIQISPDIDYIFVHEMPDKNVTLDTRELRKILGDVSLNNGEVMAWISDYILEQYASTKNM